MIRALALISASLIVLFSANAGPGKGLGMRANMCSKDAFKHCRQFWIQNYSNAIVSRTIIRMKENADGVRNPRVCRSEKEEIVRTNLSDGDRFKVLLDTRCTYLIRFRLGTCSGDNDNSFDPEDLKAALVEFKKPTIALKGDCDVKVIMEELKT
ncbi:MAG: hypothetical protein AAFV37_02490 [Pseudomonadota bacterium]